MTIFMNGDEIKEIIPDQLLVFTKSLLPPIAHDVAMGGVVTEEVDSQCYPCH
jgi:hypothetical protein